MVAWLIASGEAAFGHRAFGVRFPSFLCGLVVVYCVYRYARRLVDRPSAMLAAALAAVIPYGFIGAGLMMTPDAPLAAAWAAALYFLHAALVGDERRAWYGAGVALGLGMLSKYTIALLGPAALAFCLLDRHARRGLRRPEPYLAALIALVAFAPVIYWNYSHDWASFAFQGGGRFAPTPRFSLSDLLLNVVAAATPLVLFVLPLLGSAHWMAPLAESGEPDHARPRNRLFVACFVLVPLLVFALDALAHRPRANWTGPVWLATLPLCGWAIVHASALRVRGLGTLLRVTAPPLLVALLAGYAGLLYHVSFGIPGLAYARYFALAAGAPAAARRLHDVQERVAHERGAAALVVGMDEYWIASELSFYGLNATAMGRLLGGSALMFDYWHSAEEFRGGSFIMVSRRREDLAAERLSRYFRALDPEIHALPFFHRGRRNPIDRYYYRIGYGYRPAVPGAGTPSSARTSPGPCCRRPAGPHAVRSAPTG